MIPRTVQSTRAMSEFPVCCSSRWGQLDACFSVPRLTASMPQDLFCSLCLPLFRATQFSCALMLDTQIQFIQSETKVTSHSWDVVEIVPFPVCQVGSVGQGRAHGQACAPACMRSWILSPGPWKREREEKVDGVLLMVTLVTYLHFLLPYVPVGFLIFPFCGFFFWEKKRRLFLCYFS